MARNIERYAGLGRKRIEQRPHFDLEIREIEVLCCGVHDPSAAVEAVCTAFFVGIEAGARMMEGKG